MGADMQIVKLDEAKANLTELIENAVNGETVLIMDDEEHLIQLSLVPSGRKGRKAGSAKGLVTIADDFDAPMSDFDEYMR
jgi:antitoxin (DNA-binding transcriptional repressor) of toxin-antitoxin stability system